MNTIDYHYETLGRVLAHLVNQGLSRVDLESSDAMEIMTHRIGDEEEVLSTFADVVRWMEAEGLIRITEALEFLGGGFAFTGVQLTSKGIAVVQSKPEGDETSETIAEKVAGKPGELDPPSYTKIGAFVGGLLGGFTKSIT
jgi:hypothetical protein